MVTFVRVDKLLVRTGIEKSWTQSLLDYLLLAACFHIVALVL